MHLNSLTGMCVAVRGNEDSLEAAVLLTLSLWAVGADGRVHCVIYSISVSLHFQYPLQDFAAEKSQGKPKKAFLT